MSDPTHGYLYVGQVLIRGTPRDVELARDAMQSCMSKVMQGRFTHLMQEEWGGWYTLCTDLAMPFIQEHLANASDMIPRVVIEMLWVEMVYGAQPYRKQHGIFIVKNRNVFLNVQYTIRKERT